MMKLVIFLSILVSCLAAVGVSNPTLAQLNENDNNVLRLALTLENLDSTYFTYFQGLFTPQQFLDAGYSSSVYDLLNVLAQQEVAHATYLNQVLIDRTGSGLPKCTYNFSFITTISQYIGGGRLFENVGTGAYDGSIGAIYNKTLQQAAATIATVEARHAAFLNQLPGVINLPNPVPTNTTPFPNATDFAFPPQTVAQFILPFITSCPYNITAVLPQTLVVVPVAAPNASYAANPSQQQVSANDINTLNYALSLEILEASFYNKYMAQFSAQNFRAASYSDQVYNYFQIVTAHENAHVAALTQTVARLGGTPAPNCTYSFPVTDVASFIGVAQMLENTGVSAYDGAVNTINDVGLRQVAATIATVEARHAAYINSLNTTSPSPFPAAQDTPLAPADVIAAVTRMFITSCSGYSIQAPSVLVVNPYSNTSTTTAASTSTTRATSTTSRTTGTSTTTTTRATSGASVVVPAVTLIAVIAAMTL